MSERTKIVVAGGAGAVGREVCRLTVALGHAVLGVDLVGRPDVDEPWVEGVEWVEADALEPTSWMSRAAGAEACVVCLPVESAQQLEALEQALLAQKIRRLVVVAQPTTSLQVLSLAQAELELVLAQPEAIGDEDLAALEAGAPSPMRVERLGMALLRAALEPDVDRTLDHEALWHLGDAVMIQ